MSLVSTFLIRETTLRSLLLSDLLNFIVMSLWTLYKSIISLLHTDATRLNTNVVICLLCSYASHSWKLWLANWVRNQIERKLQIIALISIGVLRNIFSKLFISWAGKFDIDEMYKCWLPLFNLNYAFWIF